LCFKSSDDQTRLRASKVLKICFKDRSVISCFKNEPDILLTQVKILMEKTSRTRGDLALVISEISQENQESIRRIYNFAPAIQESLPKTEAEDNGNYLN
jgi:hypothetical protein